MNTKEKILFIAFQIFLNMGFENTTMNDLVKKSGVSKGAFYHYFPNKEALYNAVIDKFFLVYFKQINWNLFENKTFFELEKIIKSFYMKFVNEINNFSEDGLAAYYIMFFEACKHHPDFIKTIQKFYKQLEKFIDKALKKEGINENAKKIIAKYEGILFWLSIFPKEKIEKIINEI
jgi:AcrR family transcriptional regulator